MSLNRILAVIVLCGFLTTATAESPANHAVRQLLDYQVLIRLMVLPEPPARSSYPNIMETADEDECLEDPCEQTCNNTVGSYTCSCNEGYEVSPTDPSKCEDKDECLEYPCEQTCNNTVGSYICSCNEGYEVSPTDPRNCEDNDECVENPCEQTCNNTVGSYTCSCNEGYEVSPTDPSKCEVSGCPSPIVTTCSKDVDIWVFKPELNDCDKLGFDECSQESNRFSDWEECMRVCTGY